MMYNCIHNIRASTGTFVVDTPEVFVRMLAGGVGGQLGGLRGVLVLHGAVPGTPMHRGHGERTTKKTPKTLSRFCFVRRPSCLMLLLLCLKCAKYRNGLVDGSACSSLCDKNTLELNKCLSTHANKQVYSGMWGALEGVVRCQMDEAPAYDVTSQMEARKEAAALFDTPAKGTSVERFREMILDHLKAKVDEEQANLGELTARVLAAADANRDGRVSLAEARSSWALLQLDDFLLSLALQERGHTAKILGFCGDLYVTEKVPNAPLYAVRAPAWARRAADRWFAPAWPHRAKISIGLLELVEDLFHGAFGSFLMCDLSAARFGYTARHDFRVADAQDIVPEAAFRQAIRRRRCDEDADCVYGADCLTSCDLTKRRCNPEVAQPNLAKACRVLEDYVLRGAPSDIREELEKQLDACVALRASAERAEIQHSLVLNNLKTLLWKKISHDKDA
ncbi:divergent protein kinase domain 1A-like isoform X2 [Festucalex cinctus]